jgi:hypothetical protein
MGWFEHRHWWRPKTALNRVMQPGTDLAISGLIVEDCSCGAVQTIEFAPGQDPVVRIVETNSGDKRSAP